MAASDSEASEGAASTKSDRFTGIGLENTVGPPSPASMPPPSSPVVNSGLEQHRIVFDVSVFFVLACFD